MNIEKRRAEIAARKAEIRKLIEGDTENKLNMDDLEKELRELNEEDEKLEKETGYRAYAQRRRGSGLSRRFQQSRCSFRQPARAGELRRALSLRMAQDLAG